MLARPVAIAATAPWYLISNLDPPLNLVWAYGKRFDSEPLIRDQMSGIWPLERSGLGFRCAAELRGSSSDPRGTWMEGRNGQGRDIPTGLHHSTSSRHTITAAIAAVITARPACQLTTSSRGRRGHDSEADLKTAPVRSGRCAERPRLIVSARRKRDSPGDV